MEQRFNKLLIFDGSHCLHRSICEPHLWEMRNKQGERTGGIYGVLNTILKESSTFNYTPVVVFDGKLSQRRLDIYPNYKGHLDKQLLLENKQDLTESELLQQEMKEEYNRQREILKPLLRAFGIPVLHYENWEGDDIIYVLTKLSKDSIVVSDDKDLIQLIRNDESGKCRVRRGMRDEFLDENYFTETNSSVAEFIGCKAIVGDTSDNIPSACFQVGEKTSVGLFKIYSESVRTKTKFPENEQQLDEVCKKLNIPKRKAYLNFDENQFMTNIMLMDLSLVELVDIKNEPQLCDLLEKEICDTINNIDIETIKQILTMSDINSFIPNNLIDNINRTAKCVDISNIQEISDMNKMKLGKLF